MSLAERIKQRKQSSTTTVMSSADEEDESDGSSSSEQGESEGGRDEGMDSLGPLAPRPPSSAATQSSTAARPPLKKQSSRYEDRLREEDQSAQIAYDKRQESRKAVKHVCRPDFQPTTEESFDFFARCST